MAPKQCETYLPPRIIHLNMVEILRNKLNKVHVRPAHLKLQNAVERKKRNRNRNIYHIHRVDYSLALRSHFSPSTIPPTHQNSNRIFSQIIFTYKEKNNYIMRIFFKRKKEPSKHN